MRFKTEVVCLTSQKICLKTDVFSTGHSHNSHAHDIHVDATAALTCGDLCRVSASFGCSSKHFPGSLWAPTVPPLFTRIARIALRWRTCLLSRASGLTASRAYPGLGSTLRCTGCVGLRTTPPLYRIAGAAWRSRPREPKGICEERRAGLSFFAVIHQDRRILRFP